MYENWVFSLLLQAFPTYFFAAALIEEKALKVSEGPHSIPSTEGAQLSFYP